MARTNKYTSINFNHVIDKTLTSSSSNKNPQSNHSNQSSASNAKTHGRMLVLTRPSPKPISTPPIVSPKLTQQPQSRSALVPDQLPTSDSDHISLRPLYRPGSDKEKEKEGVFVAGPVKPNRFVPPHLRPGFVGREEEPEPKVFRGREPGLLKHEDRRPKSGGYEKIKRGADLDSGLNFIGRPRSSGNRLSSSGCWSCVKLVKSCSEEVVTLSKA